MQYHALLYKNDKFTIAKQVNWENECTKLKRAVVSAYILLTLIFANSIALLGFMIYNAINSTHQTSDENNVQVINLFALMNCIAQGVQVLGFMVLFFSVWKFQNLMKGMLDKKTRKLPHIQLTACYVSLAILLPCSIVYLAVFLVPPSLYTAWGTNSNTTHVISELIKVTVYMDTTSNGIVRIAMIIITLLVRGEWLSVNKSAQSIRTTLTEVSQLDRRTFKWLIDNYDETGQFLSLFQEIFQGWFVLQWIIYLIQITKDCMLTLDLLTDEGMHMEATTRDHLLGEMFAYLIYNISTFAIPYACGIAMNSSHEKYQETLKQKQKELLSMSYHNESLWIMQNINFIPENPKYLFIPSLCGLRIPLNSTGHSLTIVLTLLTFILSLVSKWAM